MTMHLKKVLVDLDVINVCSGCIFEVESGPCGLHPSLPFDCDDLMVNGIDRDYIWVQVDKKGRVL